MLLVRMKRDLFADVDDATQLKGGPERSAFYMLMPSGLILTPAVLDRKSKTF
jgi:hypothetical protein